MPASGRQTLQAERERRTIPTKSPASGGSGGSGGGNAVGTNSDAHGLFIDVNGHLIQPADIDASRPSVTLRVEPTDAGTAYIRVPASILAGFAEQNPHFLLEIEAPYGSYLLPVSLPSLVMGWEELLEENDWQAEKLGFKLTLTDGTEDPKIRETLSLQFPSGVLLGAVIHVRPGSGAGRHNKPRAGL